MKIFLTILTTIAITAGTIFLYQNKFFTQKHPLTQKTEINAVPEDKIVQESNSANSIEDTIYKVVKNKDTVLLNLSLEGDNKNILYVVKDYSVGFSFKYSPNKWQWLHYSISDMTASGCELEDGDCNITVETFRGIARYSFCASFFSCNPSAREGRGFELTAWNAKYQGRKEEPNFYLKDGERYISENEDYIFTYKPYKDEYLNMDTEMPEIFNTFKIIKVDY